MSNKSWNNTTQEKIDRGINWAKSHGLRAVVKTACGAVDCYETRRSAMKYARREWRLYGRKNAIFSVTD
jgi:hypothetical protein